MNNERAICPEIGDKYARSMKRGETMKNSKVAIAGLVAGAAVCALAFALQACQTYPKGAGAVITRTIGKEINNGQDFYSIYVREFEPDENGNEVIKCYEVSEEEYIRLTLGDTYIPNGGKV